MAGMFKALADPVRLRLFSRVAAHQSGEASVCDIQNVGVSQPTVSHHLKKLREAGLIISERRGTWVYCRVAPGVLPAMAQMLSPERAWTEAGRRATRGSCSPGASSRPGNGRLAAGEHAARRPLELAVMSDRLLVRSTPVPDPGEGFYRQIPVPDALAWIRQGAGLVGWGEAARVTLPAGADRFADGEKWLRELIDGAQVDDEVRRRGSGLVAFGSFTFDDASDGSVLIVPRAILGRDGTGNAWLTTITPDGETPWQPTPFDPPEPPDIVSWHDGALSPPEWEQAVGEAVRRIKHSSSLRKVVLARDLYATANRAIDARALLDRLADRYPGCYTFACDGLVGATPELLISRDGWRVSSLVLAGTTPRGATPDEDSELAAALLGSAKENEEHQYAAASLRERARPALPGDVRRPAARP